ncbi:hypothetical protein D3C84_1199550 [compost metagenome]
MRHAFRIKINGDNLVVLDHIVVAFVEPFFETGIEVRVLRAEIFGKQLVIIRKPSFNMVEVLAKNRVDAV